jgi:hypothetical protein
MKRIEWLHLVELGRLDVGLAQWGHSQIDEGMLQGLPAETALWLCFGRLRFFQDSNPFPGLEVPIQSMGRP